VKILLPAIASSRNPDGVSRHAANLAQCLLLNEEIEQVDLIVGEWQHDALRAMLSTEDARLKLSPLALKNTSLGRNTWFWRDLPKLAAQLKSDLVHAAYPVPIHKFAFSCPVMVTLHDLYAYDAPANFGYPKVLFNRAVLKQCLREADAIACVSESTLGRLDVYAPEVLHKSSTIYNYVAAKGALSGDSPLPLWQGESFLLCVAQHRANKNILLALQVFHELLKQGQLATNARLVVVGTEGPASAGIYDAVCQLGLVDSVVFLQGVSDAQLHWCYGHCELLLMPSAVEGFGLPVVEAMMHQCRVVCSDIPALREVGGTYCHYASLQADPLKNFVEASRTALRAHTFRVAPTECFSKAKTAEAYLRLYTRLCNPASTPLRSGQISTAALIHGGKQ
jgi:glycosyltransferase involved in cell wall biosynthesis